MTDSTPGSTALIVSDLEPAVDTVLDLDAALRLDGVRVVHATTGQVMAGELDGLSPDVLLLHARLTTDQVTTVHKRMSMLRRTHAVIFSGRDYASIEPHVDAGYDYLLPPFLPWAVRNRLTRGRGQQDPRLDTVEEVEAVAHLLKYERELQIGQEIQRGFLPGELPCPDGWDVAVRFRPAREVAGDFYDGFELSGGRSIGYLVADVCDKGVGAALFMALIRTLLRSTAQNGTSHLHAGDLDVVARGHEGPSGPATPSGKRLTTGAAPLSSAVHGTNDYLIRNHLQQGYFVTLFFLVLDPATGSIIYINGGHNPPVIIRRDGRLDTLPPTGPAVGVFNGSEFRLRHAVLHEGDTLFVYTDGVTEAKNDQNELFTEKRMSTLLLTQATATAAELVEQVDAAVVAFVGAAEQADDLTMLAIRRAAR